MIKFFPSRNILVALSIFLTALTVGTHIIKAQEIEFNGSGNIYDPLQNGEIKPQIETSMSNENPAPGETVTLTLNGYGININSATISWSVNGTRVQSGTGLNEFSITAGKNGEVKTVTATINASNFPAVTKTFNVTPQDVSIVYETDSYTPPFYKGRALFAKEGTVTLVAMANLISPSGAKLNPNSLVYTWRIDGTVLGSMSGYGKKSISYTGSILARQVLVEVEVSTADKKTKGKGLTLLYPQNPEVMFYEKSPLYGIMFNKELSSNQFSLKGSEITLEAVPYSVSASSPFSSNLEYSWAINNNIIPVPQYQNYATFRNTAGQNGNASVSVTLNNNSQLLQQASKTVLINF